MANCLWVLSKKACSPCLWTRIQAGWRNWARQASARNAPFARFYRSTARSTRWPRIRCGTANEAVIRREDALLADRNIAALKMDSTGRLWIGYFDRGLQILGANGERGEHLEDDHLFCVNRIAHDGARGVSAVATANGLVMFDAATSQASSDRASGGSDRESGDRCCPAARWFHDRRHASRRQFYRRWQASAAFTRFRAW